MEEMVYEYFKGTKTLYEGDYKGHHFYIRSIAGMHPTAYVEDIKGFGHDELDGKIQCYCGITYYDYPYWNEADNSEYVGWDYGHCYDWSISYSDEENIKDERKKWTVAEIYEEVKNVIEQLIKLEEEKLCLD